MKESLKDFELAEIISTLQILAVQSMGRYRLSRLLDTTKARTRLILHSLARLHLVKSSRGRGGTNLTGAGQELVGQIKLLFHLDYNQTLATVERDVFPQSLHYFAVFLSSQNLDTNGIFERDLAVRKGADGAITIVRTGDKWGYPDSKTIGLQGIEIIQNDMPWNLAIVCFADVVGKALRGAVESGLYHTESEIRKILEEAVSLRP